MRQRITLPGGIALRQQGVNSAILLSLSSEGTVFLAWFKGAGARLISSARLAPVIWFRVPRFLLGKSGHLTRGRRGQGDQRL